jgi:hypothetical protein
MFHKQSKKVRVSGIVNKSLSTMMKNIALLSTLGSMLTTTSGSRLVSEQVAAYQKLIGTEKLTYEGFIKLLTYHDDDTVCVGACKRYVSELIGVGHDWSRLETLLNTIYGDQISSDPYDPQEVHLSLRDSKSEMKVMWVTMENLQNPFVEYTQSSNEWTDDSTKSSKATTSTYTVPQNWYTHTYMLNTIIPYKFNYLFFLL